MNQRTHPEELPAEVLDDVAKVIGAGVTLLGRLPGGFDVGAIRVQLAGGAHAVLKAGQATEAHDHWAYAWRLATGQEWGQDLAPGLSRAVAGLSGYSAAVAALVGWEGAAVLTATQILTQLEFPIRHGRHEVVAGVVERGHRALDELSARR